MIEQNTFNHEGADWPLGIIRQLLCNAYNLEELKTIVQDLGYSGALEGKDKDGLTTYAREMVDKYKKVGKLGDLLRKVSEERREKYHFFRGSLTEGARENSLVYVNFVVVAMTYTEAEELFSQPQTYAREGFADFSASPGYADWSSYYMTERDHWKPHSCPESTIFEIVEDTFTRLPPQTIRSVSGSKQTVILTPQFYSQEFLTNVGLWSNLKKTGCIVIVDTVSLFHKDVWEAFMQTGISQSDRNTVSMFMLAPINLASHPVHSLITNMVRRNLQKGFQKFAEDWNLSFEFGNADKVSLHRWISAMLHRFAEQTLNTMDKDAGNLMEERFKSNGVQDLVLQRS